VILLKLGFTPGLIIFDKDGTLIDFDAMWSGWMWALGRRLEANSGLPLATALYEAMGVDPISGRVSADGRLAATPMAILRGLTAEVLRGCGLSPEATESALAASWHIPDPVALARPLADLNTLFGVLRGARIKIAIATTDDRTPTEATLVGLGVAGLVDVLLCADDGVPVKPAPHMVWAACRATGVQPAQSVVVGDTVADMQMGRAAGAGLVIGVLSGVGNEAALKPHADWILASVEELLP